MKFLGGFFGSKTTVPEPLATLTTDELLAGLNDTSNAWFLGLGERQQKVFVSALIDDLNAGSSQIDAICRAQAVMFEACENIGPADSRERIMPPQSILSSCSSAIKGKSREVIAKEADVARAKFFGVGGISPYLSSQTPQLRGAALIPGAYGS